MQTKYDIEDNVFYMNNSGRVETQKIDKMIIRSSGFVNTLVMRNTLEIHESKCFLSKAELIESL